jgi:hypothetical protein
VTRTTIGAAQSVQSLSYESDDQIRLPADANIFLFVPACRPALEHRNWQRKINLPGRAADHIRLSSADVKNARSYTSIRP